MAYGISILAAVMVAILWPKAVRRIFWAWFVFLLALSVYDYFQIERGQARVRAGLHETYWHWMFVDPTNPALEASYRAAVEIADLYPVHWWEDESEKSLLREGVLNQRLLVSATWQKQLREAREAKAGKQQFHRQLQRVRPSLVRLFSQPTGATVRIDGFECAKTPVDIEVAAGRTAILIYKEGYSDFQEVVDIPGGKSVTIQVAFARFPGRTVGVVSDPVTLKIPKTVSETLSANIP
jgi:hypothetical protein